MPNQTIEAENVSSVHQDFKVLATSTSKTHTTSNEANKQGYRMVMPAIPMHELVAASNNTKHCSDNVPTTQSHV
jgi:hypothetical protein